MTAVIAFKEIFHARHQKILLSVVIVNQIVFGYLLNLKMLSTREVKKIITCHDNLY